MTRSRDIADIISRWNKGADVASAAALVLGTDGNSFDVTGTTAITSISTWPIGGLATLHFDGALTLTHHATDLILPGGANITTAAGDIGIFYEYASGDWRCISYVPAAFSPGGGSGSPTFILEDQKSNGTNGGGMGMSWTTRPLNTEVRDASGIVTISGGRFTPTVDCWVEWSVPGYQVNSFKSRLYNNTDSAVVSAGTTERSAVADDIMTTSTGGGLCLAGKEYMIETRAATANNTDGGGDSGSIGSEVETYTRVIGWSL